MQLDIPYVKESSPIWEWTNIILYNNISLTPLPKQSKHFGMRLIEYKKDSKAKKEAVQFPGRVSLVGNRYMCA